MSQLYINIITKYTAAKNELVSSHSQYRFDILLYPPDKHTNNLTVGLYIQ